MDFAWTEDQQALRDAVVRFATNELNDDTAPRDRTGTFARELWERCAAVSIQGLPIPVEHGGSGASPSTIAYVMEGLGSACADNGLLFSIRAHVVGGDADRALRHRRAAARWLPGMADGSLIGVQAMTEPGTGSDAMALTTSATAAGDGLVLNGSKIFITNAAVADVFVVFATVDRAKGWGGVTAFLVDRNTPGIEVSQPFEKMGLRTSPMSEIFFSDCRIEESAILGKRGAGLAIFNHSMDWERSFILATAVGTMQRQVDRCVAYAKERRQFGNAIGKYQAVSHRLVEMKLRLKGGSPAALPPRVAQGSRKGHPSESAEVKITISEAYVQSSLDALYIHGGCGYMRGVRARARAARRDRAEDLFGDVGRPEAQRRCQLDDGFVRPQLFHVPEAAAREAPDQVAVVDGEREVTYAELDDLAHGIAPLPNVSKTGRAAIASGSTSTSRSSRSPASTACSRRARPTSRSTPVHHRRGSRTSSATVACRSC